MHFIPRLAGLSHGPPCNSKLVTFVEEPQDLQKDTWGGPKNQKFSHKMRCQWCLKHLGTQNSCEPQPRLNPIMPCRCHFPSQICASYCLDPYLGEIALSSYLKNSFFRLQNSSLLWNTKNLKQGACQHIINLLSPDKHWFLILPWSPSLLICLLLTTQSIKFPGL